MSPCLPAPPGLRILSKSRMRLSKVLHTNHILSSVSTSTVSPNEKQSILSNMISTRNLNFNSIDIAQDVTAFSKKYGTKLTERKSLVDDDSMTFNKATDVTNYLLYEKDIGQLIVEDIHLVMKIINYWSDCKSVEARSNGLKLVLRLMSDIEAVSEYDEIPDAIITIETFMLKIKRRSVHSDFASLSQQMYLHLQNMKRVKPSLKLYNLIIDGLSKLDDKDQSISLIESVINNMKKSGVEPNTASYNGLLYAQSQKRPGNPENAKKCEKLLRDMQRKQQFCKPDTITYNICMNAWAASSHKYGANRAESLLSEMQENYRDGILNQKPSHVSFTTVIHAWALSSDLEAAMRAQLILDLMEELSIKDKSYLPNAKTFGAVMNAWARCSLPNSAGKTEEILHRMMELLENGDVSVAPGTIHFALCIKALANSEIQGCSKRAIDLLKQMWDLYESGLRTKPDIGTYNSVLRAIANDSEQTHKCHIARELFDDIFDLGLQPDLVTYNNFFRCCCSTSLSSKSSRSHALREASEVMVLLQKTKVQPDRFTFNFFIKVIDRTCDNDDEKIKLLRGIFKFCTSTGNFSPVVLSLLKNVLSPTHLHDLLQLDQRCDLQRVKVEDFPIEWSRNADKRDFSRSFGNEASQLHKSKRLISNEKSVTSF